MLVYYVRFAKLSLIHKMPVDRRKAALFAAAVAVRLFLFVAFPSLPNLLTSRVEVSTPVSSFKRCKCFKYHSQSTHLLTKPLQCKKASFSIPATCLHTKAASFIRYLETPTIRARTINLTYRTFRHLSCFLYLPCSPIRGITRSLPASFLPQLTS